MDNRKWINDFSFGTWNVSGWFRPEVSALTINTLEDRGMDITAIQEIAWPGSGTVNINNSIVFYSGNTNGRQEFGTGFVVNKKLESDILDFKPVNERLCHIRLKSWWFNISLISAQAPIEEKEEQIKDAFYDQLGQLINSLPKFDMYLILGNFDAKIGKNCMFKPNVGFHSLHDEFNNNGLKLAKLAAAYNLLIKSTMFSHKGIHKETWVSADGKTRNQLDHILVDAGHGINCLDVRSLRGANGDTNHFLVRAKIRIDLRKSDRCKCKKVLPKYKEKAPKRNVNKQNAEAACDNSLCNRITFK